MTDNVTEVDFKSPEEWTVDDVLHHVSKFNGENTDSIIVITVHDGEQIQMLSNKNNNFIERIGLLETVKHMHLMEPTQ